MASLAVPAAPVFPAIHPMRRWRDLNRRGGKAARPETKENRVRFPPVCGATFSRTRPYHNKIADMYKPKAGAVDHAVCAVTQQKIGVRWNYAAVAVLISA